MGTEYVWRRKIVARRGTESTRKKVAIRGTEITVKKVGRRGTESAKWAARPNFPRPEIVCSIYTM